VQRLFSTFPGSWPGLGLLLLRVTIGAFTLLVTFDPDRHPAFAPTVPQPLWLIVAAVLATASLVVGFATPLASGVVLVAALAFGHDTVLSSRLLLAGASLSLMMLGPGAWSVDSRIYGRKQLWFGDD
jgi:putative oxidoreductase